MKVCFVELCHCDSYLIILSAGARTLGGIVRSICLALIRLITNSNFVGCSTIPEHCKKPEIELNDASL